MLLWRLQGPGGPLEAVAEALCSARGPSKPGGPSLTWYEASDLKELVGQEPVRALPHHSLSEWPSRLPSRGGGAGTWAGAGPHGAPLGASLHPH